MLVFLLLYNVLSLSNHQLSRQWLKETPMNWPIRLSESITLNTTLQFVPGEVSLRRVPTSKPGALFGAKMQQVLK